MPVSVSLRSRSLRAQWVVECLFMLYIEYILPDVCMHVQIYINETYSYIDSRQYVECVSVRVCLRLHVRVCVCVCMYVCVCASAFADARVHV